MLAKLRYIRSSAHRVERYMTEGGIEGVPSSRPGNYSESTEHTKYSQSVLCSTRAAQCFQRQKECGGLRNGADFSNTAGRNPYRGHLIHKMCFTQIVCFSNGGVQEKAHIFRIKYKGEM